MQLRFSSKNALGVIKYIYNMYIYKCSGGKGISEREDSPAVGPT